MLLLLLLLLLLRRRRLLLLLRLRLRLRLRMGRRRLLLSEDRRWEMLLKEQMPLMVIFLPPLLLLLIFLPPRRLSKHSELPRLARQASVVCNQPAGVHRPLLVHTRWPAEGTAAEGTARDTGTCQRSRLKRRALDRCACRRRSRCKGTSVRRTAAAQAVKRVGVGVSAAPKLRSRGSVRGGGVAR